MANRLSTDLRGPVPGAGLRLSGAEGLRV